MNRFHPSTAARAAALAAMVATALSPCAVAAGKLEFPTLKNGQWEMTTTSNAGGGGPRKSTVCLDADTQKQMLDMSQGMQKEMCTKLDMRHEGSRYITDAECRLGDSVVKSHGVMTMTGDTAYRTESTATFDPPINKDLKEAKTVIEGKYTGPCREGMQPGDMVTATGQKLNLKDLPRPPAPKSK